MHYESIFVCYARIVHFLLILYDKIYENDTMSILLFSVHVSGTSLSRGHDLNVIQADMSRTSHGKHDRVSDVFSREGGNSLVYVVSGLLVTFVANY